MRRHLSQQYTCSIPMADDVMLTVCTCWCTLVFNSSISSVFFKSASSVVQRCRRHYMHHLYPNFFSTGAVVLLGEIRQLLLKLHGETEHLYIISHSFGHYASVINEQHIIDCHLLHTPRCSFKTFAST
jgi:hypothetical protein